MLHSFSVGWLLYFADIETNECLENNGGCWLDKATNVSACKVQFCIFVGFVGVGVLPYSSLFMTEYTFIIY
jgi:hypothetical protein